jgi:hypothetical protein
MQRLMADPYHKHTIITFSVSQTKLQLSMFMPSWQAEACVHVTLQGHIDSTANQIPITEQTNVQVIWPPGSHDGQQMLNS